MSREIATAINEYLRAARRVGRKELTMFDIGRALGLDEAIVEQAFIDYAIAGAKIRHGHTRSVTTTSGHFSKLVDLLGHPSLNKKAD